MKNWNYINGAEVGNSTWYEPRRMPFQPGALRYAYEQAKKKGLSGQKLEAEMLRILKTTPHASAATESEMRKDVSEWVLHNGNPEDFVNNKGMETGNETMREWATSKPKSVGNSDREFFKELTDDAKKEEKKDDEEIEKVGNQSPQERLNQDLSIIKEECRKKGTSLSFSELAKELEKYGWNFNELRKLKLPVSVGNSKVGNAAYDMTDRDYENEYKSLVQKRNNVQRGTKEYEEIQKRLDEIRKKLGRSPFGNKIFNAKCGNSIVSEYNAEIQRLTRKAEQLRRMGQGKSAMEVEKQIEKLGKELYEYDHKPTKNSASDDKFAYVMREFDEGKLKTPDGKVVTDPAQAKAIAYSESKKAENGLTRARNAIKK